MSPAVAVIFPIPPAPEVTDMLAEKSMPAMLPMELPETIVNPASPLLTIERLAIPDPAVEAVEVLARVPL